MPVSRVCLIVLDGWGLAPAGPGNAIELADTPVFDQLWAAYPHTELEARGLAVGLPDGQMGNSEVGHLNLGAGAVVKQDLTRIDEAVADGSLDANPALRDVFAGADRVHLIGLVSDGGVHSSLEHLRALIQLGGTCGTPELVIHAFTDGRDTLPHGGVSYVETLEDWCRSAGHARVGSVVGRYFAMDRDSRWDRTQRAYDLLVAGRAEHRAATAADAVRAAYEREETDEFIAPTLIGAGAAIAPGRDSVLAFNFRPDRMRQISRALAEPDCADIDRRGVAPVARYTTMTEYEGAFKFPVAFPPARPQVTLAGVLAEHGLSQLHVAETEKYAHVTYFFNGGREEPFAGEQHELIPSPRDVPTYDQQPEMSAGGVAESFVHRWCEDGQRFGVVNFANPDMVGHTGDIPAAVHAVETVDRCLGDVVAAVHETGGACLVTADHGNADNMLEPDGSPNTAHSLNPVPLIVTVSGAELRAGGVLADVAPTVLRLLELAQPEAMTGRSLVT
ncbi:MAG: 2,3-bisphosphoglycerate-independent phosphoglycerate mutase [Actinomycetota bacterium]|nr:2,3-bisphosphoglycerate-independent phosphoglycerate mutase [Actinomycetota bacterium]